MKVKIPKYEAIVRGVIHDRYNFAWSLLENGWYPCITVITIGRAYQTRYPISNNIR